MTDISSIDLSVTNIWRSWVRFRRGKKPSREIRGFEANLEYNLLRLAVDLNNGTYSHGGYTHRIVNEKKRRDIAVAEVRDRIVHRLLYDYMVTLIDLRLDYDVWSCRPKKGLHKALKRTHTQMSRYENAWVWRADISKFFDNINHVVLREVLIRHINDSIAQNLLDKVISSYSIQGQAVKLGIPIGNLTSQILGNLYLNEFDRFVRSTLKPLAYIRYGDDFIVIVKSEIEAKNMQAVATEWLAATLYLPVHETNNVIIPVKQGLYFLGHILYPRMPISVNQAVRKKIQANISARNIASYKAMQLPQRYKVGLDWWLTHARRLG